MNPNIKNDCRPRDGVPDPLTGLIEKIQKRLTAEVVALKYVDQDWGQMDFFAKPPVKFPCALIDIQNVPYTNAGENIQQGTATVVIRLFDIKLSNSSNGAPANQKENARKIWRLLADVNRALHGVDFLNAGGKLIRQEMRRTKRADGCYQTELYYTTQFTDTTTKPQKEEICNLTPVISVTLLNEESPD